MEQNVLNLRIAGPAGTGVKATGMIFSRACMRGGLHVFSFTDYPSLIRGGCNTFQIRVEEKPVLSSIYSIDALIVLTPSVIDETIAELRPGGVVICDEKDVPAIKRTDVTIIGVPTATLLKEAGLSLIMKNQVFLGLFMGLTTYPFDLLEDTIRYTFAKKEDDVIVGNIMAAQKGYDFVKQHNLSFDRSLSPIEGPAKILVSGNEAVALGALSAGIGLYVAYPMTPSTAILHFLAKAATQKNIVVKQGEDEIGVANLAIGAAHAGARAMCGTSGGGFALMQEAVSLAGITETPVVFVEVMRGAPATGVPTWTEQADLRFVMHAGHGDFPKVVLAPGDVDEAYEFIQIAFNAADKYQCPAVLLSDKYLGESYFSVQPFTTGSIPIDRGKIETSPAEGFERYAVVPDGISPRSLPGTKNGIFVANSDEHTPKGYSEESIENRNAQVEKRGRKLAGALDYLPKPELFGEENAAITIISFGSNKGAILQAIAFLKKDGITANFLHVKTLVPFHADLVKERLMKAKKTLVVEQNHDGQFRSVIRENTLRDVDDVLLKYSGRQIYPEEILAKVKEVLQ
ncbi:MAG: 2-oxoacid:acceptor oxidoreductase subunit alpha [Candidatus Woesearchaeota archaeon]|nr:MAG: 2-oxoacid:acceptor oxidoreductase subunit alpha [Candidatus Woesearchaeota archaeon]